MKALKLLLYLNLLTLTSCSTYHQTRNKEQSDINKSPSEIYLLVDHSPNAELTDYYFNGNTCFIVNYAPGYFKVHWYYIKHIEQDVVDGYMAIFNQIDTLKPLNQSCFVAIIYSNDINKSRYQKLDCDDVEVLKHVKNIRQSLSKEWWRTKKLPPWLRSANFVDKEYGLDSRFLVD